MLKNMHILKQIGEGSCSKNHYDVNKKGLTKKSVKPFLLEQSRYPINNAVNRACGNAVEDNGAGDREYLCADAEDESLCLWSSRTH